MYSYYGIGVNKQSFFDIGGRPVIYGLADEENLLDDKIKWRFQAINPPYKDWTWFREWRINKQQLKFNPNGIMVIAPTEEEKFIICNKFEDNTPIDYKEKDGAFLDIEKIYAGISIEKIASIENKEALREYIKNELKEL